MSATEVTPKRRLVQKLGYGQGSLYEVTSASGATGFVHIYSEDGKQREVRLASTSLTAARREVASRNTKRETGELAAPSKRTLGHVAEELFAILESRVKSGELRSRTLDLYRQRYRSHLEPKLARKVMQKVDGSDVSSVIVAMRAKNLSPSLIGGVLMVLGQVCDFGVQRRYLASSPMSQVAKVERPKVRTRTEPRVLNLEEIEKLVDGAPRSIKDFLSFVAFTGCRMSEALAIRWSDLDLEQGTTKISGQLARGTFQRVPTKTASGNREIYLPDSLVSLLKERRVNALAKGLHGPNQLVFSTKTGAPLSHRNVAREITRAGDNAGLNGEGIQPVSCHDLRHSFVSRLISKGIDPVTVAALAGDKVETILKVYAHEYDRARRSAELRERIVAANTVAL